MIDISLLSDRYFIRRLVDADADDILRFCEKNTLYYQYCNATPSKEQVLSDLHIAPPGVEMQDKYYLGFFIEDELAAVLDLIDGYPEKNMAFIGFFMMNADLQGRGLGTGVIGDVCDHLRRMGFSAVRLAIAEDNPQANRFWAKNGFAVIGKVPMDGWTALVAQKDLA